MVLLAAAMVVVLSSIKGVKIMITAKNTFVDTVMNACYVCAYNYHC